MRRQGVRLDGLKVVVKPSGRRYVYHRAPGGKLTRLPDLPENHPDFIAAWLDAAGERPRAATPRTIAALVTRYVAGRAFRALAETTRAQRRRIAEKLAAAYGEVEVRAVAARHVRADLEPHSAQKALNRLKVWRALFAEARRLDWIAADPTAGIERPRARARPHPAWSAAEVEAFRARWPLGTDQRLALELLYWWGARRGDVVTLGRQHLRDGWIRWRQSKTGAEVALPVPAALAEALALVPPGRLTFLETAHGRPRSPRAFGAWFRRAAEAAGVTGRSAHGLRHLLGADAAAANIAGRGIGSLTGHRTLAEIDHYSRAVDARSLAAEAMARLEAARAVETPRGNRPATRR